jgi:hypothetical protein
VLVGRCFTRSCHYSSRAAAAGVAVAAAVGAAAVTGGATDVAGEAAMLLPAELLLAKLGKNIYTSPRGKSSFAFSVPASWRWVGACCHA